MKLQMQSLQFVADRKLTDFIQKKTDKLDTYCDQIIDGEVIMKLDKNDRSENKIVEIKLNVPGRQLFAKHQAESFESATDEVVEGLRRQIKRYKQKAELVR